jgi:hypothetical protein
MLAAHEPTLATRLSIFLKTLGLGLTVDELEMKILGFLSDEEGHLMEDIQRYLDEEDGIEAAVESLQRRVFVQCGEEDTWLITEEGLNAYNIQTERESD